MEFKAKPVDDKVNSSQVHPLKDFFTLLLGISAAILVLYWLLGLAVDWVVDNLPAEYEPDLFRATSMVIEADQQGADNMQLSALVAELAKCADYPQPIQVQIVEQDLVNAVALPGRQMLVYRGLLDKLKTQNGLAFVLAHEISHFKHKDHLRGLGRGIVLGGLSALVFGSSSGVTQALTPAVLAGEANYSQSRENAADAEALGIINCHYGHVAGATELFEKMQDDWQSGIPGGHFLASHPEAKTRIAAMKQLARENGFISLPGYAIELIMTESKKTDAN